MMRTRRGGEEGMDGPTDGGEEDEEEEEGRQTLWAAFGRLTE